MALVASRQPDVLKIKNDYLKASPLPPAPLAVAFFLVAGLVAWQSFDGLAGLLACWVLLSVFCFANTLCWSVCWLVGFWMLDSRPRFFVFAAATLQPLSYALL